MNKYILAGVILWVVITSGLMIYENQNTKEFNDLVDAVTQRVLDNVGGNGQQLTYPLDPNSVVAVEKATDTFLYTKIFDLVWKKTFHYYNFFESLDSLDITYGGAVGTVAFDASKNLVITTAGSSTNYADVHKRFNLQGLMTFSQPSSFRTSIQLTSTANVTAYIIAGYNSGNFYGFKVHNGNLYGVCSNSGTGSESTVLLGAIADGAITNIEARYTVSEQVIFIVNTVELGKLRTSLPSSLVQVNLSLFNIKVITNTNSAKSISISYVEYLQRRNALK